MERPSTVPINPEAEQANLEQVVLHAGVVDADNAIYTQARMVGDRVLSERKEAAQLKQRVSWRRYRETRDKSYLGDMKDAMFAQWKLSFLGKKALMEAIDAQKQSVLQHQDIFVNTEAVRRAAMQATTPEAQAEVAEAQQQLAQSKADSREELAALAASAEHQEIVERDDPRVHELERRINKHKTDYINADIDEAELEQQVRAVLDDLQRWFPENYQRVEMMADNILPTIKEAKVLFDAAGQSGDPAVMAHIALHVGGKVDSAIVSSQKRDWINKGYNLIAKGAGGRLEPLTSSAAVGLTLSLAMKLPSMVVKGGAMATGVGLIPGVGAGISAAVRRKDAMDSDRARVGREIETGSFASSETVGGAQRQKLKEYVHRMESASILTARLNDILQRFNGVEPYNLRVLEVLADTVAEVEARLAVSKTQAQGLIRYSNERSVYRENRQLMKGLSSGRLVLERAAARGYALRTDELRDQHAHDLMQSLGSLDKDFSVHRRKQMLKAAAVGGAVGFAMQGATGEGAGWLREHVDFEQVNPGKLLSHAGLVQHASAHEQGVDGSGYAAHADGVEQVSPAETQGTEVLSDGTDGAEYLPGVETQAPSLHELLHPEVRELSHDQYVDYGTPVTGEYNELQLKYGVGEEAVSQIKEMAQQGEVHFDQVEGGVEINVSGMMPNADGIDGNELPAGEQLYAVFYLTDEDRLLGNEIIVPIPEDGSLILSSGNHPELAALFTADSQGEPHQDFYMMAIGSKNGDGSMTFYASNTEANVSPETLAYLQNTEDPNFISPTVAENGGVASQSVNTSGEVEGGNSSNNTAATPSNTQQSNAETPNTSASSATPAASQSPESSPEATPQAPKIVHMQGVATEGGALVPPAPVVEANDIDWKDGLAAGWDWNQPLDSIRKKRNNPIPPDAVINPDGTEFTPSGGAAGAAENGATEAVGVPVAVAAGMAAAAAAEGRQPETPTPPARPMTETSEVLSEEAARQEVERLRQAGGLSETAREFLEQHGEALRIKGEVGDQVYHFTPSIGGYVMALTYDKNSPDAVKARFWRMSGSDHQWKAVPGFRKNGYQIMKGEEDNPRHHYVQSAKLHPEMYKLLNEVAARKNVLDVVKLNLDLEDYLPIQEVKRANEIEFKEEYINLQNKEWQMYQTLMEGLYRYYEQFIMYNGLMPRNLTVEGGTYKTAKQGLETARASGYTKSIFEKLSPYVEEVEQLNSEIEHLRQGDDVERQQAEELVADLKKVDFRDGTPAEPRIAHLADTYLRCAGEFIEAGAKYKTPTDMVPDFAPENIKNRYFKPVRPGQNQQGVWVEEYEVSNAEGDVVRWAMARDTQGRVYVDNVYDPRVGMNDYGTPSKIMGMGFVVYKPEDYAQQVMGLPSRYVKDTGSSYLSISTFWSENVPVIRQYQEELQRREAQQQGGAPTPAAATPEAAPAAEPEAEQPTPSAGPQPEDVPTEVSGVDNEVVEPPLAAPEVPVVSDEKVFGPELAPAFAAIANQSRELYRRRLESQKELLTTIPPISIKELTPRDKDWIDSRLRLGGAGMNDRQLMRDKVYRELQKHYPVDSQEYQALRPLVQQRMDEYTKQWPNISSSSRRRWLTQMVTGGLFNNILRDVRSDDEVGQQLPQVERREVDSVRQPEAPKTPNFPDVPDLFAQAEPEQDSVVSEPEFPVKLEDMDEWEQGQRNAERELRDEMMEFSSDFRRQRERERRGRERRKLEREARQTVRVTPEANLGAEGDVMVEAGVTEAVSPLAPTMEQQAARQEFLKMLVDRAEKLQQVEPQNVKRLNNRELQTIRRFVQAESPTNRQLQVLLDAIQNDMRKLYGADYDAIRPELMAEIHRFFDRWRDQRVTESSRNRWVRAAMNGSLVKHLLEQQSEDKGMAEASVESEDVEATEAEAVEASGDAETAQLEVISNNFNRMAQKLASDARLNVENNPVRSLAETLGDERFVQNYRRVHDMMAEFYRSDASRELTEDQAEALNLLYRQYDQVGAVMGEQLGLLVKNRVNNLVAQINENVTRLKGEISPDLHLDRTGMESNEATAQYVDEMVEDIYDRFTAPIFDARREIHGQLQVLVDAVDLLRDYAKTADTSLAANRASQPILDRIQRNIVYIERSIAELTSRLRDIYAAAQAYAGALADWRQRALLQLRAES